MTRRRPAAGWLLLCVLSLLTMRCARGDSPAERTASPAAAGVADRSGDTTGSGLSIEYKSQPEPPRAGENAIEVTVRQPDGSPVSDAAVAAVFSMPAMPSMNMPAMRSTVALKHQSGGRYVGTESLSMAGTWNVTVTVSRGDQQLGQKRFSVIAK